MRRSPLGSIALGALLAVGLTACTNADAPPAQAPSASNPVFATPSPTAHPVYGDQTVNERGNRTKAIGQPSAITAEDGAVVTDFAITKIGPANCSNKAANGRLLLLNVSVNTHADPTGLLQQIPMGSGREFITPDGTSTPASTDEASVCRAEQGPYIEFRSNRKYAGVVVLDVPQGAGVVAWAAGGASGWEWPVAS
jgi:hypothetical protein